MVIQSPMLLRGAVDGVAYTDAETETYAGDTVPSSATSEGENWVCTVTPNDGEENGPSDSAGVTIEENCAPLGGDGVDGDVTVAADATSSLSVAAAGVTGDNPAGLAAIQVDDASGFVPGDEILIITMSSTGSDCDATASGYWEIHDVAGVDSDTLSLRSGLDYSFDTSGGAVHQAVRVPSFRTVAIGDGGTLTAERWDGRTGGVLIFRARSLALGLDARVDMSASGYLGGVAGDSPADGPMGESWIAGGQGGAGGDSCSGTGCVGSVGADGTGGGGGGGSGGANPAVADGGTCGGGGGGGRGSSVAAGGGLGAGDGGMGGTGGTSGRAGGAGGGCAADVQSMCPEADGQRLLMGSGAPNGASGGCAHAGTGGHYDGGSGCGTDGADGYSGRGCDRGTHRRSDGGSRRCFRCKWWVRW